MVHDAEHTPRPTRRSLRRVGLGLFFASVACNAVIGIYALVAPGFGDTEGRILGTSLYVTAALLLVLACEPALEARLLRPVPLLASVFGAMAFALLIVVLWGWSDDPPEILLKVMGTLLAAGLAGTLASLLVLARLSPRYAPVRAAAYVLTAVAAGMIVLGIWLEPAGSVYTRMLGVVLVALAALVVTIPVLHRLSRTEFAGSEPAHTVGLGIAFCPGCGERLPEETGPAFACGACGRAFTVTAGMPGPAPERLLARHA